MFKLISLTLFIVASYFTLTLKAEPNIDQLSKSIFALPTEGLSYDDFKGTCEGDEKPFTIYGNCKYSGKDPSFQSIGIAIDTNQIIYRSYFENNILFDGEVYNHSQSVAVPHTNNTTRILHLPNDNIPSVTFRDFTNKPPKKNEAVWIIGSKPDNTPFVVKGKMGAFGVDLTEDPIDLALKDDTSTEHQLVTELVTTYLENNGSSYTNLALGKVNYLLSVIYTGLLMGAGVFDDNGELIGIVMSIPSERKKTLTFQEKEYQLQPFGGIYTVSKLRIFYSYQFKAQGPHYDQSDRSGTAI